MSSAASATTLGWKISATASLRRRAGAVRATAARALPKSARADAAIIDGKAIAEQVREEVRVKVAEMKEKNGKVPGAFPPQRPRTPRASSLPCASLPASVPSIPNPCFSHRARTSDPLTPPPLSLVPRPSYLIPGLAVVLVGDRKDSETYVRSKKKACAEAGIESFGTDLPGDATEEEVLEVVAAYNADPSVHGILVQLPMPDHINEERVLGAIDYEKDVDGFHPLNIGRLSQRGREPLFVPCTPRGCIELLERSGIEIAGKEAVVVGRSNVVGTPAALLLQRRDATVTIVHSRTPNSEEVVKRADIVIAACGRMEMVKGSWIKPGAAVRAAPDPSSSRFRAFRERRHRRIDRSTERNRPELN